MLAGKLHVGTLFHRANLEFRSTLNKRLSQACLLTPAESDGAARMGKSIGECRRDDRRQRERHRMAEHGESRAG